MEEVNFNNLSGEVQNSVSQEEVHNLLFDEKEIGWREIIFDLIHTEQLNPWNIDIGLLADKYLEKIQEFEEMDFFVSSKVLLASALLLRIKSEFLLNKYVRSIDEILFPKKEQKSYSLERIELDEDIPDLVPRSPMPRSRKVSLDDLISSLNKAIETENRRIRKVIVNKNALRETGISLPKKKISIKDKLMSLRDNLLGFFEKNKEMKKIHYSEFIGKTKDERISGFFPLLQLENNGELWLHQERHFEEIHIWLKNVYLEHHGDPLEELREVEEIIEELKEGSYNSKEGSPQEKEGSKSNKEGSEKGRKGKH